MTRRWCFSMGIVLLVLVAFLLVSAVAVAKKPVPPSSLSCLMTGDPVVYCTCCFVELQKDLAACEILKDRGCNKAAMDEYHYCVRSNGC